MPARTAAPSQVSVTADAPASGISGTIPRPPRHLVIALLAAAGLWWAALVWLAATAANPVTLNREQLRQADAIVSVEVLDREQGAGRLIQQWSGVNVPAEITVNGMDTLPVRNGAVYILPLTVEGPSTFHVTQARLGIIDADGRPIESPAYVYPAGEESEQQLRQFLATPIDTRR